MQERFQLQKKVGKGGSMQGSVVTRVMKDGSKRYYAIYRAGGKQKWRGFARKKDAERHLTNNVKKVQDGSYIDVQPQLMGDLFDRWRDGSVTLRVNQGLLKPSTAKSYRSMMETH